MRLPIRAKIAELQAAVSETLSEMDLRLRVRVIDGEIVVRFESDTGYSPVDIVLPDLRSPQPTWDGCEVGIRDIARHEISDNGWLYFSMDGFREEKLRSDDAWNYALVNRLLRSQGVVLDPDKNDNVTSNDDLANLAAKLRERLRIIGDFEVLCKLNDGIEIITSVDADGREWQIAFEDDSPTGCAIYVDGESVAKFEPSEASQLIGYMMRSFWSRSGPRI
jgi:hypothetical protein